MLAPMGSGALWARRELLEAMPPFLAGGEMIREVHLRRSEFNEIPWKFEAGTPDVGDAIGLGVAADYLTAIGMDAVREHERELVAYALEVLPREVPGIELYGPLDPERPRRRHPVQPAGHPPARRGPGPGPLRDRHPGRPPLHDAAPRAPRPRGDGPGHVQRLHDPRGHRRAGRRPRRGRARLQRLTAYTHRPMDDLYRDYILEHYRRPHNFGVIEDADASYEGANPLCGDRITLMLGVTDGVVDRVGFTGRGCAISQASACLLTDEIKGKPLAEVADFGADDLLDLLGIEISPARLKCAMLSHDSLQHVLTDLGVAARPRRRGRPSA